MEIHFMLRQDEDTASVAPIIEALKRAGVGGEVGIMMFRIPSHGERNAAKDIARMVLDYQAALLAAGTEISTADAIDAVLRQKS